MIYLSAAFSRRGEMRIISERLAWAGFPVNSRWVHEEGDSTPAGLKEAAYRDMEDLRDADTFVRYSDPQYGSKDKVDSSLLSGARMVEMGAALALGKTCYTVGGHQPVFDYLPSVIHVESTDELVRLLKLFKAATA